MRNTVIRRLVPTIVKRFQMLLAFVVLAMGCERATSQVAGQDEPPVVGVYAALADYWGLPEFATNLAAELNNGVGSEVEKERRLEARLREVLAEPELGHRLEMVRDAGPGHGWRISDSDLEGTTFSAPVASIHSGDRAQVNTRRQVVRVFEIGSEGEVAAVFERYPVRNVNEREIAQRAGPSSPIFSLSVVSLDRVQVDLIRQDGRWKVSDARSKPEFAWAFVSD